MTGPADGRDDSNPFSRPHGAMPVVYALRDELARSLAHYVGQVSSGKNFPLSIGLYGCRGSGKTLELNRLEDELLVAGCLPVRVDLVSGGAIQAQAISSLLRTLHEPDRQSSPNLRFSVKGRLPFVEVGVEGDRQRPSQTLKDVLLRLFGSHPDGGQSAIVFLLDEGDFLTTSSYEAAFSECLGWAASVGLPVGVVAAGTTRRFLEALQGESTYMSGLSHHIRLRRLDRPQSRQLLVETAAKGGQDWSSEDVVALTDACRGVPRQLQAIGGRVFEDAGAAGFATAASSAVTQHRGQAEQLTSFVRPHDALLIQAIMDFAPSSPFDYMSLIIQLASSAKFSGELADVEGSIDRLMMAGVLDLDEQGRLEVVRDPA